MAFELVRNLPYDHPYRWNGTTVGGLNLWRPTSQSGLMTWIDAEDSSTITLNGATVSAWADKTAAARNLAQATTANQPTYNATAINSKPAVVFDGIDDFMAASSNIDLSGNVLFSIVGIMAHAITNIRVFVSWGASTTGNGYHLMRDSSGASNWTGFANNTQIGTYTPTSVTTPYIFSTVRTSTSTGTWAAHQNGSALTVTAGNSGAVNVTNGPLNIGRFAPGGSNANVTIGELMIISGQITDSNRQILEGYLAWKWALEGSLPASHPYKNTPPTL